jgi:hypothetical protein
MGARGVEIGESANDVGEPEAVGVGDGGFEPPTSAV